MASVNSLLDLLQSSLDEDNKKSLLLGAIRGQVNVDAQPVEANLNGYKLSDMLVKLKNGNNVGYDNGTYFFDNQGVKTSYNTTTKDVGYQNKDFGALYNLLDKSINIENGKSGVGYSPQDRNIDYYNRGLTLNYNPNTKLSGSYQFPSGLELLLTPSEKYIGVNYTKRW